VQWPSVLCGGVAGTHWVRYNAFSRRKNVMDRVTAQSRAHVV